MSLIKAVFRNVEAHLEESQIDPIEVLKRGRYWLDQLNR